MKNKAVLKGASVLLIVAAMVLSTFGIATDEVDKQQIQSASGFVMSNDYTISSSAQAIFSMHRNSDLFTQLPRDVEDPLRNCWTSASDSDLGWKAYDDFWDISSPICDIHWWGFSMFWTGEGWNPCDPAGMTFDVTFYRDEAGEPGAVACSYRDITYSITPTGIMYEWWGGYVHELLYFEAQLESCCELSNGWVSVESTGSDNGCWFLWMNSPDGNSVSLQYGGGDVFYHGDLAFILTGGESALCCEGALHWGEVTTGDMVTGTFQVCNCGQPGSLLNWQYQSGPTWGIWEIEPDSGADLAAGECVTITVNALVPSDKNKEFTGVIKMVNTDDSSDYCEIEISLTTPKFKTATNLIIPNVLERLFDHFPLLARLLHQ